MNVRPWQSRRQTITPSPGARRFTLVRTQVVLTLIALPFLTVGRSHAADLQAFFFINASDNPNTKVCSPPTIEATATPLQGRMWDYTWTLYIDGQPAALELPGTQSVSCLLPFRAWCTPVAYKATTPLKPGKYMMRLAANDYIGPTISSDSNVINVTTPPPGQPGSPACPFAVSSINGNGQDNVTVCPGGPIQLDGSQSFSATGYFVGIEFSDRNWTRLGGGGGSWINAKERQLYGSINNFNVKKFAEDRYIKFVGGQYYRVKLAVGSPWHERTQLMFINPPVSSFTINRKPDKVINVLSTDPIRLDGSASTCAMGYFVSVQQIDATGKGIGSEVGRWLMGADFSIYGGSIKDFDVKGFAKSLSQFKFEPGQFYRVKLAVGGHETTKVIAIGDPCICTTPNCSIPASCSTTVF